DETKIVFLQKLLYRLVEGEPSHAHVIGRSALMIESVKGFAYCGIAATHRDYAKPGTLTLLNLRLGHELSRSRVLFLQAVDNFLILVRNLRVSAKFVVPRSTNEICAFRAYTWDRARRDEVFVFIGVSMELRHFFQLFRCQDSTAVRLEGI